MSLMHDNQLLNQITDQAIKEPLDPLNELVTYEFAEQQFGLKCSVELPNELGPTSPIEVLDQLIIRSAFGELTVPQMAEFLRQINGEGDLKEPIREVALALISQAAEFAFERQENDPDIELQIAKSEKYKLINQVALNLMEEYIERK